MENISALAVGIKWGDDVFAAFAPTTNMVESLTINTFSVFYLIHNIWLLNKKKLGHFDAAPQSHKAVTAYFTNKQLQHFVFKPGHFHAPWGKYYGRWDT